MVRNNTTLQYNISEYVDCYKIEIFKDEIFITETFIANVWWNGNKYKKTGVVQKEDLVIFFNEYAENLLHILNI